MTDGDGRPGPWRPWRSFRLKLAVLAVIFLSVPVIVYLEFQAADAEKDALVLRTVQRDGRLIAEGLRPLLSNFRGESADDLLRALERLSTVEVGIKLLFRPRGMRDPADFVYVAAVPPVPDNALDAEHADLLRTGVLDILHQACEGGAALAGRHVTPTGGEEILTSITPVAIPAGCWTVITAHSARDILGQAPGEPYWQVPEVRVALIIYGLMAVVVLSLFTDLWRSLRRFADLARAIRRGGAGGRSFASLNRMPELDAVARDFDALVGDLRASAERVRQAAEENAHAFKTPLAVIAQSIEPLRPLAGGTGGAHQDDGRARRSLDMIERAVDRLDALVSAAREMDRASAELMAPVLTATDATAIGHQMARAFADDWRERGLRLVTDIAPDVVVTANEDMIETVIENLLSNAADFSPSGGCVTLRIARLGGEGAIEVIDEGPGVPEADLERIFERYISQRLGPGNFGIGLWIVRRNAEAAGGAASAANRREGGLRVTVRLPLAAGAGHRGGAQ